MPGSAGLGVGLGQMSFGTGTIVFSGVFHGLMTHFGRGAIVISSLLLSIPTFALSFFVSYPETIGAILSKQKEDTEKEASPLVKEAGVKLPPRILLREPSFLLYILIVFTAQAGFAFMPLFFKLGTSFGRSLELVVMLFQVASLLSTAARLGAGILVDKFSFGADGKFSSGSKNLLQVLFALQSALFVVLIALSNRGHFQASVWMVIAILVTYSAANCSCTLLARDIFSSENSATVFGVGAGLMMGVGEAASTGLGTWLVNRYGSSQGRSGFTLLYAALLVWSLVGFLCAVRIDQCEIAFRKLNTMTSAECEYGATHTMPRVVHLSGNVDPIPILPRCDSHNSSGAGDADFRIVISA